MTLKLSYDGATATLTLDRPDKRNAINTAMWRGAPALLAQVEARLEVRVLIVRGAGGHFASGADIGEFDEVFASREAALGYLADMGAATAALEALPIPVIAAVEGLCIGAGVAFALACDIRLASSDARFAITPAKLGLAYTFGDTRRVVSAVGASAAKDLLFTGRMIDAGRAASIGLIDEVFDASGFEAAVTERAGLMAQTSSWTHSRTKAMVRMIEDGLDAETDETRALFADATQSADFAEGLAAFKTRRPPAFPAR